MWGAKQEHRARWGASEKASHGRGVTFEEATGQPVEGLEGEQVWDIQTGESKMDF